MALAGVELETLVSEPDAQTTRPTPCAALAFVEGFLLGSSCAMFRIYICLSNLLTLRFFCLLTISKLIFGWQTCYNCMVFSQYLVFAVSAIFKLRNNSVIVKSHVRFY